MKKLYDIKFYLLYYNIFKKIVEICLFVTFSNNNV